MMASALLSNGIDYLAKVSNGLGDWLETNDYSSIKELQGLTSQFKSKDSGAFERSEYLRAITTFRSIV